MRFKVGKVDPVELEEICVAGKKSAHGLDNWHTDEFAMLSSEAYVLLAELMDTIEEGAPWPDGTEYARAAFLSKDAEASMDPMV